MARRVAFHPAARKEFRAAVARYEAERPGLGVLFAGRVRDVTSRAAEAPLTGAPYAAPAIRRLFVARFPYSVIYLVEDDRVFVIAIAHFRRYPEYWHGRTAE